MWEILILAVVQGATEFLPVSSSGHVVIVSELLRAVPGASDLTDVSDLNVVLHMGTLLSILVFYWRRICRLVAEDRRVVPLLVAGSIPAAALGVPAKLFMEDLLESPLLAGILLIVTGIVLIWAARCPRRDGEYPGLSYRNAFLIGLSQAAALFPGLSRSGVTISTGLALGLSPRSAATFAFLLAIPAIAGAGLLEAVELVKGSSFTTPLSHLAVGVIVSFAIGLAALAVLVRLLERGRFGWFAWWCIPLGAAVIVWQIVA